MIKLYQPLNDKLCIQDYYNGNHRINGCGIILNMAIIGYDKHPSTPQPIMVAMSGGVDSSVAAALLIEQGYQVSGILMRLYETISNDNKFQRSLDKAQEVSARLNIPLEIIDYREEFRKRVIGYFLLSQQKGITPNPCFICNVKIKWGLLLGNVLARGVNWLASGHYARIVKNNQNKMELYKGMDPGKDQSYVLSGLDQNTLSHMVLPLAAYSKNQIREIARRYNLDFKSVDDSQDLCFFDGLGQEEFLNRYAKELFIPGEIKTQDGRLVGMHNGLANYTIGQRKGLGAGNKEPIYVLRKDIIQNVLIVGPGSQLGRKDISVTDVNWISGDEPPLPDEFDIKIRYRSTPKRGTLNKNNRAGYDIIFAEPIRDPTPGQIAVFYKNDQVIGSAFISDTTSGENI